ncbi:MAG TPA: TonB-dependent receptor, partial [Cyclobacteriaceae bacterium]|nr:TonB-dependent receptor [Cyclobacteriaceae bacterium]
DHTTVNGVPGEVVPTYEDASMGGKFDGHLVYQSDAYDVTSPNYQKMTPWVAGKNDPSTFFETQVTSNTNVSIEGGGDKSQFKLNYTKSDDKGILPNSSLKKDFINFSSAWDLTSKLKASAQINFSNVNGVGRYGTGYSGQQNVMTSFRQWWEMNVDIAEQRDSYDRNLALYGTPKNTTWNYSDVTANPPNLKAIYWDNVYWSRRQNFETDNRLRYFGNARIDYNLNDWLSFMGRASIDSYSELQEERIAFGSTGVSRYSRFNRNYREINYDLMAIMKKDITPDINLRATLGYNQRMTSINSVSSATNGGLVVPMLYAVSNSVNPPNPPVEGFSDIQVNGYYANASVGYKKTVYIDGAYRVDVSSTLPKGSNSYSYYSLAGSFVFSELLGVTPWLTVGKIRANYAEVGNSAPFNALKDLYDKPTAWGSVPLFSIPNTKNNSLLKPERTKNMEFGLEMAFFDGRVGFDATYYKSNSINQLIPISVSTATGSSSKYINAGDVENSGIELTVFGVPFKTPDFEWRIDLNWTRNRNIVNEIYTDANGVPLTNILLGSFQNGVSTNAALGQPYGTLRGKDFTYTADGQRIVGADGYYVQTTTSNNVIGNVNPNWIGGINNRLTYKNLSLSFLIDIKNGGNVWSLDQAYGQATGIYQESAGLNDLGNPKRNLVADGGGIILPGVTAAGAPNTTRIEMDYDALGYTKTPSRAFVYDASYVKLREVQLTYSFPQAIVSKLGPVKGIDLSLVGRNLWIIQKFVPYSDPEDSFSSGNVQGAQIGALPNVKTTGFNVKFRF